MRWFWLAGGVTLLALACGVPESAPVPAPVPEAPGKVGKRGKKAAAGDCPAYCEKWASCAHVEGWEFDPVDCARSCKELAAHPQGAGVISCLIETPECMAAIGCTLGE
jgi:hypothetical protein